MRKAAFFDGMKVQYNVVLDDDVIHVHIDEVSVDGRVLDLPFTDEQDLLTRVYRHEKGSNSALYNAEIFRKNGHMKSYQYWRDR
jgi:hypothetical protein